MLRTNSTTHDNRDKDNAVEPIDINTQRHATIGAHVYALRNTRHQRNTKAFVAESGFSQARRDHVTPYVACMRHHTPSYWPAVGGAPRICRNLQSAHCAADKTYYCHCAPLNAAIVLPSFTAACWIDTRQPTHVLFISRLCQYWIACYCRARVAFR